MQKGKACALPFYDEVRDEGCWQLANQVFTIPQWSARLNHS
jgi:hypothetical protein